MSDEAVDTDAVLAKQAEATKKDAKVAKKPRARKPKEPKEPKDPKDAAEKGKKAPRKKKPKKQDEEDEEDIEPRVEEQQESAQSLPSAASVAIDGAAPSDQAPAPVPPAAAPDQEVEDEEYIDDDVVAKAAQTLNREETKALLDTFDEETLSRYEVFRRAHLPKAAMRKVVSNLVGPIPASVAIGKALELTRRFADQPLTVALEIMDERGESGPITPAHLREAFRRYQRKTGTMQNKLYSQQLFS
ncbi:transcription initiation factor TFIID subunit 11 [Kappamyces sp. JEL0829]|nr:transcription initiation factor TFIID subunit 11 [Kappamyces sp. JEL0829]